VYLCCEKSQTVPLLWNGSFHDTSFLCTKPLIIVLLEQDYPTDCKSVIECLYWNAAPERIVNQNFHLFYLCYEVFLVELCGLCRDGLTVPSNSSSFEVPNAAFWSVFVTWGWSRNSPLLLCSGDSQGSYQATAQSTNTRQFRILSKPLVGDAAWLHAGSSNVANPMSQDTQCMAAGYAFKFCKSVHHHTLPISQPTRCNNFPSCLLDVYVRLNMFRVSSRPSSGPQQLQ